MEGQLIQYVNDNDPNSEVDYFPYTTFNAVFEDESKTLNLKQYIEEKILKSEQGGALGVEANTVSGGAVGNKASSKSGGAVGASAKTVTGGAVGENTISKEGGAVGENAVTLSQSSITGVLSDATLPFEKEVKKGSSIPIKIENNEIPSNAVNINIINAYTKTKDQSPRDYFNIEMGIIVAYNSINAILYARKDFTPTSDVYESSKTVENVTPIYVDIEYQIETNKEGGTGFAGGFNSKARSGGAIGESSKTIGGGAAGQGAESTWGGAVGQNAFTRAGGAIGLRSYSEVGGAIGVDSKTTLGGAIGFMSESGLGFAGGYSALTKDGGAVGASAKTVTGGAVGKNAISEKGGAVGENAGTLLQLSENEVLSGITLPFGKEIKKGSSIKIKIESDEILPSTAVNINIANAYTRTKDQFPRDYFDIEMGTVVDYNNINVVLQARKDFTPTSDIYESSETVKDATPIYVDIEYQTETDQKSGTGFAGGFNSKARSGGAIGESSKTAGGGAMGQRAKSNDGGAGGYKASTQDGGAIGIWSYSTSGGAIGVSAETTTGGAVGNHSESSWGFAGGYKASTKDGGAVGSGASSDYGGAVGSDAKSKNGFAGGLKANASGENAIALGAEANASGEGSVQIGTGTNSTKDTLKFKGHQISNGTAATASGSDMAEYFEWKDGNINSEDRRGYFVTLDNEKIKFATSKDDYILGVVSSEGIASFIGNTSAENWKNKYLKDIYGDFILNENGEKIINSKFNDKTEYLPRFKRAEWAVVCLIGQIVINDDGTCIPGGYCKVNDNGEGTIANIEDNIKYKVLERLDNNHVRILFR